MTEIPLLVIALFDLSNTTDPTEIPEIQKALEAASNRDLALAPFKMDVCNQIYFRDKNLNSFVGRDYNGLTDDQRALRAFISDCFSWVRPYLPGRKHIVVYHSPDYAKEAQIFHALIAGQQLKSSLVITQKMSEVLALVEV